MPWRLSFSVLLSIEADVLRRVVVEPFTSTKLQVSFTNCTTNALSMSIALKVSPCRRSSVVVLLSNRAMKPFSSRFSNVFTKFGIETNNVLIEIIEAIIHMMNHSHPQPVLRGVLSRRMRRIVAIIIETIGMSRATRVATMNVINVVFGFANGKRPPKITPPMPVIMPMRAIVRAPITITPMNAKNSPTMMAAMRNSHLTISPRREPMRLADSRNCSL